MNIRAIGIAAVALIGVLAWQKFSQKPPEQTSSGSAQVVTQNSTPAQPASPIVFTAPNGEIGLSSTSAMFQSWVVRGFTSNKKEANEAVDFNFVTHYPFQLDYAFDLSDFAYVAQSLQTPKVDVNSGQAVWNLEDEKIKVTRTIQKIPGEQYLNASFRFEFKSTKPNFAFISIYTKAIGDNEEALDERLSYYDTGRNFDYVQSESDTELTSLPSPMKWIAVTSRYFVLALINTSPIEPKALIQPIGGGLNRLSFVYPVSSNILEVNTKVFFGPKKIDVLKSVEPTLDHVVDLGWFTFVAYPILNFLKWLYDMVGNWGVAIILLTIVIKILTYPLQYMAMKGARKMQVIQPQLTKIKEKYKDDREALNREMLMLMKGQGYNPLAGCLPILIQIPIFFALYRVIYSYIELYHAPFAFWIQDLSSKDPYYITPVLLTATMFIQQHLTPTPPTVDPIQQKMLKWMPVIFGVFMLALPSGLTLYMLTNAIVSIIQQWILNKQLGIQPNAPVVLPPKNAK